VMVDFVLDSTMSFVLSIWKNVCREIGQEEFM
jgi:hypothetical protein